MGRVKKINNLNSSEECFIDAHCHICNEPLSENYIQEIENAAEQNISLFISTALTQQEFYWYQDNPHPSIKIAAGIHPYYDNKSLIDINFLKELADNNSIWAIGEIGFDKRKNNHHYQSRILYQQLELALEYNLPVIFHIVGRYNELYNIIKNDFPDIRGYIHGFSGSPELFMMLTKLDIGFSIGYRIFQQKEPSKLLNMILDNGNYLFETDAPFQRDKSNNYDYLSNLISIIREVSALTSYSMEKLLDGQWNSYKMLSS